MFEGIALREDGYLGADERELVTCLAESFLSAGARRAASKGPADRLVPPGIEIDLWIRSIDDIDDIDVAHASDLPVDAIAVGHYMGVRPRAAALALDSAVSAAVHNGNQTGNKELIFTEFIDRGTLTGELGRIFLLPDPREKARNVPGGRAIAVAGMGH